MRFVFLSTPTHLVFLLPPLALFTCCMTEPALYWNKSSPRTSTHVYVYVCVCTSSCPRPARAPLWWCWLFCCEHGFRTATLLLCVNVYVCIINASGCDLPTLLSAWFMLSPSTQRFSAFCLVPVHLDALPSLLSAIAFQFFIYLFFACQYACHMFVLCMCDSFSSAVLGVSITALELKPTPESFGGFVLSAHFYLALKIKCIRWCMDTLSRWSTIMWDIGVRVQIYPPTVQGWHFSWKFYVCRLFALQCKLLSCTEY